MNVINDLANTLRSRECQWCQAAADEIERLTAALAQYADHTNWQRTRDDTAYEWDGEIERPWRIAEEALK